MPELREVTTILESGKVEETELNSALQALLFHQCLYEDWPNGPAYRLLSKHMVQVQPIVAAFGFKATHQVAMRMITLQTERNPYGVAMTRLKKDETLVLLALRLLYAEQISSLDEQARVEITTDDIHDRLHACGEEPPEFSRLLDILKTFHRKGLARVGDRDGVERSAIVTIMPGITVLVPDVFIEGVILWLEQRAAREASEARDTVGVDMLTAVANHRAELGAAVMVPDADEDADLSEAADVQP